MQTTHLNHDEFKKLIDFDGGPAVSIYMPTHRTGPETRQDPIRFKNLLNGAEAQLKELDADNAKRILEKANTIPEDVVAPFCATAPMDWRFYPKTLRDVSNCRSKFQS